MQIIEVTSQYYHSVLNELPADKRAFLEDRIIADKYYLAFEGLPFGGFAVRYDGYLTGLFSLKAGKGKEVFSKCLELALQYKKDDVKALELFCIGDKLKRLYEGFGFTVRGIHIFQDALMSDNWDYKKYGRPPLYTMMRGV